MAHKPAHPLDALTNDGRTQVAYMQRLGYIGSSVVDDDFLRLFDFFYGQIRICLHLS